MSEGRHPPAQGHAPRRTDFFYFFIPCISLYRSSPFASVRSARRVCVFTPSPSSRKGCLAAVSPERRGAGGPRRAAAGREGPLPAGPPPLTRRRGPSQAPCGTGEAIRRESGFRRKGKEAAAGPGHRADSILGGVSSAPEAGESPFCSSGGRARPQSTGLRRERASGFQAAGQGRRLPSSFGAPGFPAPARAAANAIPGWPGVLPVPPPTAGSKQRRPTFPQMPDQGAPEPRLRPASHPQPGQGDTPEDIYCAVSVYIPLQAFLGQDKYLQKNPSSPFPPSVGEGGEDQRRKVHHTAPSSARPGDGRLGFVAASRETLAWGTARRPPTTRPCPVSGKLLIRTQKCFLWSRIRRASSPCPRRSTWLSCSSSWYSKHKHGHPLFVG